ncbi:beta-ketoacyl-ACP synthase II [soil metagenome]
MSEAKEDSLTKLAPHFLYKLSKTELKGEGSANLFGPCYPQNEQIKEGKLFMLKNFSRPRRVVITGMGCATPIGVGREAFFHSLQTGVSGTRWIESFDVSDSPVKIAGEVRDFDWQAELKIKDRKHVPRTVPLALFAAREALSDAGIDTAQLSLEQRREIGVEIGTGGGGLAFAEKHYEYWFVGPRTHASVYIIPASTHGGLSSEISMAHGLRGLSHVVSTGCTSSTDAIFYAAQHIALGRQNVMIAGGVDAPLAPGILAGFNLMTVLTNSWNDEPHRASRPFAIGRDGIVVSEGSYIYVLEDFETAVTRKARIYAEITGYGATCDAYHRVRLDNSGIEPARAMSMALDDAGVSPDHVDYVNLHGTSTVLNDKIETVAVKLALGDHAYKTPMSATKSQLGHPQGASGAAGLGAALCAMTTGIIPPTINLDEPDPDCDLDYVPNVSRKAIVDTALCNCIGFGSKNSALVVERYRG